MTQFVLPSTKYKKSFLEAVREFKKENNLYVLSVDISVEKITKNFPEYVEQIRNLAKGIHLTKGYVPETVYWLVDGNEFLGRASIRHRLTSKLRTFGGHIGYEVRPTQRKKGYGKEILKWALKKAKKLGIKKVLVTCNNTNIASRKIIEGCGGVLCDALPRKGKCKTLRFWINNFGK